MKKFIISTLLTISLIIPNIALALNVGDEVRTISNNTNVRTNYATNDLSCKITKGTKVKVLNIIPRRSEEIRIKVLDGPHKDKCEGFVYRHSIESNNNNIFGWWSW